jgi:class 3 adenylate cyclase/tetratricopeptide (TPR) repeat protein
MATCTTCSALLPEGARFCPNCAAPIEVGPGAQQRKLATVLFADLVGSTALGGSLDPEHVRDMLDRFYDAMTAEIAVNGGTVEKFIGDAVVAVFGAPAAQENHAERALDAALSMRGRLRELFEDRLALRIGVNTGEVVVGRPREGSSFVTGDAVNVAARLEQAAQRDQILVGERTVAAVGAAFEFGERRVIEAKGKPRGVACRELIRMLSRTRARGARGLPRTFVGRESELAWLQKQLDRCIEERRPGFAALVGEPGVGKTSVVDEFTSRLPDRTLVRLGRCISYGRGVTYSPLADVLRAELGLLENDSPKTVTAKLAGREILGMTLGLAPEAELDPRAAAEQLRAAWVTLLSGLAAERTVVVVVIEDLHWASAPLNALLQRVLTDVSGPLFVLATTRPEKIELPAAAHSLTLEPLSPDEIDVMLERLLGAELRGPARDLVIRHAEGNPFFVEELVSMLIDQGLVARDNAGWTLRGSAALPNVPDSLQAVLAARIDLLEPGDKTVLQAASVVGRRFTLPALQALTQASEDEVGTLLQRGFLHRGESEFVFKHALTREVAYFGLPKANRAQLHAVFASWLESTSDDADMPGATLAHHYAQAVDPEIAELAWRGQDTELHRLSGKALRWLRRAAEIAVAAYDIDEAVAMLLRAAKLTPDDAEIWRSIGHAYALKFDGEAYWEAMLKAIELTTERESLADLYSELAFESSLRGAMWKRAPAPGLVDDWLKKAHELARPDSRPHARALLASSMRNDESSIADADHAIAIAEELGDIELLSYGYFCRWQLASSAGDYAAAHGWAGRRLALADRFTDPDHIAHIHQSSAAAALGLGRMQEAEAHANLLDSMAGRLSAHHAVHAVATLLSVAEAAGDWQQVRELQERAERAVAESAETPCAYNARSLMSCAAACAELGLDAEVRRLEAATMALELEGYRMWFDPLRAHVALIRGDLDRVQALLDDADRWLWPVYVQVYAAATRLDALLAIGRMDEAEEQASRHAEQGGYLEPFALRTLGLVRGNADLLNRAAQRFEDMGLDWHALSTRALKLP